MLKSKKTDNYNRVEDHLILTRFVLG